MRAVIMGLVTAVFIVGCGGGVSSDKEENNTSQEDVVEGVHGGTFNNPSKLSLTSKNIVSTSVSDNYFKFNGTKGNKFKLHFNFDNESSWGVACAMNRGSMDDTGLKYKTLIMYNQSLEIIGATHGCDYEYEKLLTYTGEYIVRLGSLGVPRLGSALAKIIELPASEYLYKIGNTGKRVDLNTTEWSAVEIKETGEMFETKTFVSSSRVYTHDEALEYCETLELAGFNDYRLPDKEEISSIFTIMENSDTERQYFLDYLGNKPIVWTSSVLADKSYVCRYNGTPYTDNNENAHATWCIRN